MPHQCHPAPACYRVEGHDDIGHYIIPHHVGTAEACEAFLERLMAALRDCLDRRVDFRGRTDLSVEVDVWDTEEDITVHLQPHNGEFGSAWMVFGDWRYSIALPDHPEVAAGVLMANLNVG